MLQQVDVSVVVKCCMVYTVPFSLFFPLPSLSPSLPSSSHIRIYAPFPSSISLPAPSPLPLPSPPSWQATALDVSGNHVFLTRYIKEQNPPDDLLGEGDVASLPLMVRCVLCVLLMCCWYVRTYYMCS